MVNDRFQNLDRRLRQELLALDGAMVLDHLVHSSRRAIVSVPAGSEGGGRTAAAKKGSSLGLAIKISEDGGIPSTGKRRRFSSHDHGRTQQIAAGDA